MLENVKIDDILFLDIETVPKVADFNTLDAYEQELWEEKRGKHRTDEDTASGFYFNNAGIFAEFGKIICISVGYTTETGMFQEFELKSFYGDDEVRLLNDFIVFLQQQLRKKKGLMLCGHNIREFDVPYICRRLLINNLKLPDYFENLQAKKPWEAGLLDSMDFWKFGDFKNYISLKLLAFCLGIPSPKDDISGKDVGKVYWNEHGLERIKTYCQKDVLTVAQIVLKLKGLSLISESNVKIIN
ncbi:MAG TPA: ribonuclease H-like domain-containing protein [Chitinophagales bacterium]|nr:ribonuclease H-like domain-containing protein [Chitinophagales bacterium]